MNINTIIPLLLLSTMGCSEVSHEPQGEDRKDTVCEVADNSFEKLSKRHGYGYTTDKLGKSSEEYFHEGDLRVAQQIDGKYKTFVDEVIIKSRRDENFSIQIDSNDQLDVLTVIQFSLDYRKSGSSNGVSEWVPFITGAHDELFRNYFESISFWATERGIDATSEARVVDDECRQCPIAC